MKRGQEKRAAWMAGKVCVRCGTAERLEIDHIDPSTKLANPTSVWTWSEARRLEELSKCQTLCRECHIKKSREDMGLPAEGLHSNSRYRRGCRCEVCKKDHAEVNLSLKRPYGRINKSKYNPKTADETPTLNAEASSALAAWRREFDARKALRKKST